MATPSTPAYATPENEAAARAAGADDVGAGVSESTLLTVPPGQ